MAMKEQICKRTLNLSEMESEIFITAIYGEVKCLIDGWDADIGRCPSKTRMGKKGLLSGIVEKWEKTQPPVPGKPDVFIMCPARACVLILTNKEAKCCKDILSKKVKDSKKVLSRYMPPYTGALIEIEKEIKCAEWIITRM